MVSSLVKLARALLMRVVPRAVTKNANAVNMARNFSILATHKLNML